MSFKTILVYLDDAANVDDRIRLAASLARTHDAHLVGAAMTGIPSDMVATWTHGIGADKASAHVGTVHRNAARAVHDFEATAHEAGVAAPEGRIVEAFEEDGAIRWARYADLVVVGQYNPDGSASPRLSHLGEHIAMSSGAPVLVLPYAGRFQSVGQHVLVAWNGSTQSARALRHALPLLQNAAKVDIAVFSSASDKVPALDFDESRLTAFLARHSVQANVIRRPRDEESKVDVGDLLLSMAADVDADLLVMGCYGHTRFRETLFGGVTRTVLRSMTIPVFIAH
nr:universal stress protein [uncultured Noviherbaspirillum sp.]